MLNLLYRFDKPELALGGTISLSHFYCQMDYFVKDFDTYAARQMPQKLFLQAGAFQKHSFANPMPAKVRRTVFANACSSVPLAKVARAIKIYGSIAA
jgi:hypothetical protein